MIKINYNSRDIDFYYIPLDYLPFLKGGRTFAVSEDLNITLSDGSNITIPRGFETDLASIPSFLWSVFKPIDKAFIADLIHDYLWENKMSEILRFDKNIFEARKFADEERLRWRKKLMSNTKVKNWVTHRFLRMFGGFWYSRQIKIPN